MEVTIDNPPAPDEGAEVLSSGRDRWRPSRRQAAWVVTALLLALATAGPMLWVRHDHRLDRAAAAGVEITAGDLAVSPGDATGFRISVGNASSAAVRLLGVLPLGEGYTEAARDVVLAPHQFVTVPLAWASTCSPSFYTATLRELRVRVRTTRGDAVTRDVPLAEPQQQALTYEQRQRCRFLLPHEALSAEPLQVRREGDAALVRAAVLNSGALPLTITRLGAFPGLSASARLPVTVPPRHRGPATLLVTLRVSDCQVLQASQAHLPEELGRDQLRLTAHNDHVAGIADVSLTQVDGDESTPIVSVLALLAELCPPGARR